MSSFENIHRKKGVPAPGPHRLGLPIKICVSTYAYNMYLCMLSVSDRRILKSNAHMPQYVCFFIKVLHH